MRAPNLLWNEAAGRVVLVDFERAKWIKPVKAMPVEGNDRVGMLGELSSNKGRKRVGEEKAQVGRKQARRATLKGEM